MRAVVALELAVLAGAAAIGCSSPRNGDVLLLTIDTLRPDHLGIYGYARPTSPGIDRWFADGLVYERAYSTEANTPPSVVSLLAGLLPQDHGVRLFYQLVDADVALLPELLPDAYQTAGFVSNVVLTGEALGIAARFDHFDDHVDERESRREVYERNARRTTDAVLRWLERGRDSRRPLFLWVHYIDPHGPYRPPRGWSRTFSHAEPAPIDPERVPRYQREPGLTDGAAYVDLYDEELAFVDAEVDRLLRGYAERAPLERALVIFTADHGESMMEHERWFTHGYHVYEEIVRVPLLLRGPGVPSGRTRALASGVDVAPTILAFTGAPRTRTLAGVDLRSPEAISGERVVFTEATNADRQWRAAIAHDGKWIAAFAGPARSLLERRFYALDSDPAERRALAWREGEAARRLLELSARDPDPSGIPGHLRAGLRLSAPKVAPDLGPDELERLRALGYVE